MLCQKCGAVAVISNFNGTFCADHFKENFEKIVLETIEKYGMIEEGERIAVANSGGKDSLSLLYILSKYFGDKNDIVSITIDEGIHGYRDKTIGTMKKYCEMWGVDYVVYSYKDFAGLGMDDIVKKESGIPCASCGVLRRHLINAGAIEQRADKLLTAHNMDDEAESVLMNIFQKDYEKLLRSGPISGIEAKEGFVPRVKPFIFVSEKETMLFSILNGIDALHTPCPYSGFGFRGVLAKVVKQLESDVPGSKKKIIDASIFVKNAHSGDRVVSARAKLLNCSECGSPSSRTVCEACAIKSRVSGQISKG